MQFGFPITTLRDRILGNVNANNFNRETVFQRDEELSIVEFAETSDRLGYGLTNPTLQRLGGELAHKLERRDSDKPLTNCWLYGFLQRWKDRI